MNEKDQKTYALDAGGADLKVGDKVQAKGKLTKDRTGSKILHVKVFKDMGSCPPAQAQAQTQ